MRANSSTDDPSAAGELTGTSVRSVLTRAVAHFGLISVMALIPVMDLGKPDPSNHNLLFTETSMVELSQLLLLAASLAAACSLWVWDSTRALGAFLAALLAAALVRELDYFLDGLLFDGAWQIVMTLLVIANVRVVWPQRAALYADFNRLVHHFSFGLMFAGAATVLGFSRIFGRSEFWEALLGNAYDRSVKNLAEESVELLGYSILAVGVAECALAFRAVTEQGS